MFSECRDRVLWEKMGSYLQSFTHRNSVSIFSFTHMIYETLLVEQLKLNFFQILMMLNVLVFFEGFQPYIILIFSMKHSYRLMTKITPGV